MMLLLLSILTSLWIGLAFLSLFWADRKSGYIHLFLKCCLATGLGFGISSCCFFLWLLLGVSSRTSFAVTEIALFAIFTGVYFYGTGPRNYSAEAGLPDLPISNPKIQKYLAMAFYAALVGALVSFVLYTLAHPHGNWDAWTIWNMRARFVFRTGAQWKTAFSPLMNWSHTDYPLLIPCLVTRCWYYIGHETVTAPALVSGIFTFATVGLAFSSIAVLRNESQGYLAGLVLLGTPFFIQNGTFQYADIPLGFFFMATMVLFSLHDSSSSRNYNFLLLAGITAGLSAWTKNEGQLFVVSILITRFALILTAKGWRTYLKEMRFFAMGLLPVLIILIYFKIELAPPNDLFASQGFRSILEKMIDLSRYIKIMKAFVRDILQYFGHWIVFAIYMFLLGGRIHEKNKPGIYTCLLVLCLMFAGYFSIYVITPHELVGHMKTSLSRLLVQLWPSFVFLYFMIVNTPERSSGSQDNGLQSDVEPQSASGVLK